MPFTMIMMMFVPVIIPIVVMVTMPIEKAAAYHRNRKNDDQQPQNRLEKISHAVLHK